MSDRRYNRLVANIEKYGFLQPILVYREKVKGRGNNSFVLSDGKHRIKAMTQLGQKTIEAKIFASRDDAESAGRILRIAMNNIRGEGSLDLLSDEISSMLSDGLTKLDLEDTGVDEAEIDAILSCSSIDVSALLSEVSQPDVVERPEPVELEPRSHKLTFIFATEQDKQTVVEKLEAYEGGPAEALLQALLRN
jgi:ParB-like chromosome segregation protein Spo0J